MKIRIKVSILLLSVVIMMMMQPMVVMAEEGTANLQENLDIKLGAETEVIGKNYRLNYEVTNSWDGGFAAHLVLSNTGDELINKWQIGFSFDEEISNIWGAKIVSATNGYYIIQSEDWAEPLDKDESTTIELIVNEQQIVDEQDSHYNVILNGNRERITAAEIKYEEMNSWEDGYEGKIIISNTGTIPIEDWQLAFKLSDEIVAIWNGQIVNHVDCQYVIRNTDYNKNINPGEAIEIGIIANKTAEQLESSGYELTGVVLEESKDSGYEYRIFNKDKVTQIDIAIKQEDWEELLANAIEEEYVPCDVTINGVLFKSVGIRTKGNASLLQVAYDDTTDRYSFKMDFDQYIEGQTAFGLDRLALNNNFSDATCMSEYLAYELFTQMGVPSPLYSYANITINGEPWGCYLAVEDPKKSYAKRLFGEDYGRLYKPEGANVKDVMTQMVQVPGMLDYLKGMSDEELEVMFNNNSYDALSVEGLGYFGDEIETYGNIFNNNLVKSKEKNKKALIEAIKYINEGTDLEQYIDVDEVLRYFAVNTAIVNLDSYVYTHHNYILYEDKGKVSMLPWDLNLAFGAMAVDQPQQVINFPIDTPIYRTTMAACPLLDSLLAVDIYKARYHEYLQEVVDKYLGENLVSRISEVEDLIAPSLQEDSTAFYTYDEHQQAVQTLKQLMRLRTESIQKQLAGKIPTTYDAQADNEESLIEDETLNLYLLGYDPEHLSKLIIEFIRNA